MEREPGTLHQLATLGLATLALAVTVRDADSWWRAAPLAVPVAYALVRMLAGRGPSATVSGFLVVGPALPLWLLGGARGYLAAGAWIHVALAATVARPGGSRDVAISSAVMVLLFAIVTGGEPSDAQQLGLATLAMLMMVSRHTPAPPAVVAVPMAAAWAFAVILAAHSASFAPLVLTHLLYLVEEPDARRWSDGLVRTHMRGTGGSGPSPSRAGSGGRSSKAGSHPGAGPGGVSGSLGSRATRDRVELGLGVRKAPDQGSETPASEPGALRTTVPPPPPAASDGPGAARGGDIRRGQDLSDRLMFRVAGAEGVYLRVAVHHHFEDGRWMPDERPMAPRPTAEPAPAATLAMVDWADDRLPAPFGAVGVRDERGARAADLRAGYTLRLERPARPGERLTVLGIPASAAAGADDDPADYRQLPRSVSARTRELARVLRSGSRDTEGFLQAISVHFARETRYQANYPPLTGPDPVDEFLFVTRRGSCQLFSTAACVLLRIEGFAVRWTTGFVASERDAVAGELLVRARHAHAWCEVFLPGRGWTLFDPTPPDPLAPNRPAPSAPRARGGQAARRAGAGPAREGISSHAGAGRSSGAVAAPSLGRGAVVVMHVRPAPAPMVAAGAIAPPRAAPDPARSGRAPPPRPSPSSATVAGERAATRTPSEEDAALPPRVRAARRVARAALRSATAAREHAWRIAGAALAATLIALVALRLTRGRRAGPMDERPAHGSALAHSFYARARARLAECGVPREPGETPYEVLARAGALLGDVDGLADLVDLHVRGRYSPAGLADAESARGDALALQVDEALSAVNSGPSPRGPS